MQKPVTEPAALGRRARTYGIIAVALALTYCLLLTLIIACVQ